MREPVLVRLPFIAPIPLGRQVECRTFLGEKGRFAKEVVPRSPPLVTDLETGVVYGEDWMFADINAYVSGEVRDIPLNLKRDLREHSRFRGRVRACQVVWIGRGDSRYPQTTLLVEPENEATTYR